MAQRNLLRPDHLNLGNFPPYKAFYHESMLFITNSAISAICELNESITVWNAIETDEETNEFDCTCILNPAQTIITQAAALARYFWPIRAKRELHSTRAKYLRLEFQLDDTCPLKSRTLRDLIEHFDEKLDHYLSQGIVGNILPAVVGDLPEDWEVPTHIFRGYDPAKAVFEVLGNRFELEPIVNALSSIHDHLVAVSDNRLSEDIV